MQSLALISGLIGALISGALGFAVRWYLDGRTQREAERRIAYVHYLAVSDLLAMEDLVLRYLKALGLIDRYRGLADSGAAFSPSHRASVIISDAIHAAAPESLLFPTGHGLDPRLLKHILESLKDSKLNSEALSKLPRATIQSTSVVQHVQMQVALNLGMWTKLVEEGSREWITPSVVHEHWLAILRLLDAAKELKASFIAAGVVSAFEAKRLHQKQVSYQAQWGFSKLLNDEQIAAAAVESDANVSFSVNGKV